MRKITHHRINGANEELYVAAMDEPGNGGANHEYKIYPASVAGFGVGLSFQNGAIKDVGVNGLTNEALLAVLIDRMEGFQSGPFACDTNQQALDALKDALAALSSRTKERLERGVEGRQVA